MSIFKNSNGKLSPVSEQKFDLEKDIQKLTEENLDILFGLKFVSGSLNKEFSVKSQEHDFYIDTLAFNEQEKSIVVIEYKKDRSFSVIDQGFSYLSAMLANKADFVLELNERLKENFSKGDIKWDQSRLIFIAPEFTNYQKNAINFKDLPFFLYEVNLYDNGMVEYDLIKPFRATASINNFVTDKIIKDVAAEVKVYNQDNLIKDNWKDTKELVEEFENQLLNAIPDTKIRYTQNYIAYDSKPGHSYVETIPQQKGLKIYFRFPNSHIVSNLSVSDCSKVGRWANGISYTTVTSQSQISEAVRLASESLIYSQKRK